jgi:hypothetical protein
MRTKTQIILLIEIIVLIFLGIFDFGFIQTTITYSTDPTSSNFRGSVLAVVIDTIIVIILIILILRQLRTDRKWSKVVAIARSHEEISLDDLSKQSGVPNEEVRSLVFDAISSGHLSGVVKENRYVRSASAQKISVAPEETTHERIVTERVFVICPYCGGKTEQGVSKCRNCDAQL